MGDYTLFIGRCKQAMYIKGLKTADIAKATGISVRTIECFFAKKGYKSERTALLIARVLEIER